jgi:ribosomal protein L21
METIKAFIKSNWKYLAGLALVLALIYFGRVEYNEWKQHIIEQAQKQAQPVIALPPQIINTKTETIREVAVQAPSQEGAILQFIERQGKVIAIVNGQEIEVPNVSGQPDVKIGENGELRFSTSSTTKIDVTEMANAQARLIANQELEKQAKINAEEMKKEKSSRKKERIGWILGTAAAGYLLTR